MEKHRNHRKHKLSDIKQNTRKAPDISLQEYEQFEDLTHFNIPQNTRGKQDISKFNKILLKDKAVQNSQDNRGRQDVSKSRKLPEKHKSRKTGLKVQKFHYKELQNTFQNCTHQANQKSIANRRTDSTIRKGKETKKQSKAKQTVKYKHSREN